MGPKLVMAQNGKSGKSLIESFAISWRVRGFRFTYCLPKVWLLETPAGVDISSSLKC